VRLLKEIIPKDNLNLIPTLKEAIKSNLIKIHKVKNKLFIIYLDVNNDRKKCDHIRRKLETELKFKRIKMVRTDIIYSFKNPDESLDVITECQKLGYKIYNSRKEYDRTRSKEPKRRDRKRITKRIWESNKLKTDPLYKLKCYTRSAFRKKIKKLLFGKFCCTEEISGTNWMTLYNYITSLFQYDMCWENYGKVWVVDHIIPISQANTKEEVEKVFHYTNLQPLPKAVNSLKRDNIWTPEFTQQMIDEHYDENPPCLYNPIVIKRTIPFIEKDIEFDYNNEEWKIIKGFENYQISNFGRVRNKEKLLKVKLDKKRLVVKLSKNNKKRYVGIRTIVAEAFVENFNSTGSQVFNIDGNPYNNSVENLGIKPKLSE
jgi:hypothetical protein